MDKIAEKIDYTEIIQNINESLKKLSSAKRVGNTATIEEAYEELNIASFILTEDKEAASEAIKNHYNKIVYNLNNGVMSAPHYLNASIIREIIQNIIDCNYKGQEIRIAINFDDKTNTIRFKYNEEGFKISNIISFLSLNNTTKDSNNTGAFGVGAKGTILNAKGLKIDSFYDGENSHGVSLEILTKELYDEKSLFIENFSLFDNVQEEERNFTQLELTLEDTLYREIKTNFLDLAGNERKGKYITPIDLMFASLKQADKNIMLTVEDKVAYKIRYSTSQSDVRFYVSGQLIVGLKVFKSKESEFSYLIPFVRNKDGDMPKFITRDNYNYFSTYELTGKIESDSELPKFFVNIPTVDKKYEQNKDKKYYITSDRKGIHANKITEVEEKIAEDFKKIVNEFEEELSIDLDDWSHRYVLKYLYEFIEYKESNSVIASKWRSIKAAFNFKVSFKHGEKKVRLGEIKKFNYNQALIAEAQKLKDNVFIFKYQASDFHGVNGRKTFDLNIQFHIVFFGEVLSPKILSDLVRIDKEFSGIKKLPDFKHSAYYKEAYINNRILYNLEYRSGDEIFLISAENDKDFTEHTLLNLLKAIEKKPEISVAFDNEKGILEVGEHQYPFGDNFKVTKKELLYSAYWLTRKIGQEFFDFICKLYKKELFHEDVSTIEKLAYYTKNKYYFKLSFSHSSHNLMKVFLSYSGSDIPLEELDVTNIDYDEIVKVTGLTNYKFLIGKTVEDFSFDQNIGDVYNLDLDAVKRYSHLDEIDNVIDKIYMSETNLQLGKKDLVAFVKDGVFKDMIQLDNISSSVNMIEFDYIFIISKKNSTNGKHSKIRLSKIAEFLDVFLDGKGKIKEFFKPIDRPLIKMLDQFSYKLKPILDVKQEEIEVLKACLKNINENNKKMFFAKDLTNKLYGYSTCCSLCNYKTDILNAFHLKEIKYVDSNMEQKLNFYVCSNHYFEADGWVILDVNFQTVTGEYSISFNEWMDQIQKTQCISANLLKCEIQIIKRSSYRIFELDEEEDEQNVKKESHTFILTPLLAVKWLMDNNHSKA